jgi:radical SAM superfamily enzyme YgiQ (UPF0313 family)
MKQVRFVEPQSRQGTLFAPYVRQWPLMGPVILGTILHELGHNVVIYNENATGSVLDDPRVLADLCEADWVGISIMTPTANRGYAIADGIRARSRRPRIAIGGVHATFRSQEALEHADFVVAGEGEGVVGDLVEGRLPPGVIQGLPVQDMNTLPLPRHELIHQHHRLWSDTYGQELYRVPLVTSRGCPYNCKYCSVTALFGHRYRYRSAEKVIGDIRRLYDRGYRRLFFYDDNFTADRGRVRTILDAVRELGITWNAQARLDFHWKDPGRRDHCDWPLLDVMRRSGGDVMFIGYETIEEEVARRWRKGYQGAGSLAERSAEDTRILHDAGFWIHGMFVAGPEQDEGSLDRMVQFAERNHIESLQISALTPFPGTATFEECKDRLLFTSFPEDWALYDGMHALCDNVRMGIERFQRKLFEAHKAFYRDCAFSLSRARKFFRGPGSLFQKLCMVRDNAQLPKRLFAGWETDMQEFLRRVAKLKRRLPQDNALKR